jgi:DsbC/DsbD-like thiol-disulfide interchange protein
MMAAKFASRRLVAFTRAALAFAFLLSPGATLAADASASPWTNLTDSKVRLVSGTVELNGKPTLLAGVQLRMNPGWKTYWKNPGDSGVPPHFNWSQSKNLKRAEVLYPAPHRFDDGGGTAIGYDDEVLFPVRITPEREGEPVELKLTFEYGLCKDLCIPNQAELGLPLTAGIGKGDARLIETFLARVPQQAAADHLPKIDTIAFKSDGNATELVVDANFASDASATDLFIDAGDSLMPVPKPLGAPIGGKQRFVVSFATPEEAAAIKGKPLSLTLVSDRGSTETLWTAE